VGDLQYFTGLFRRFRSFVLRREVEVVGQCRLCGNCCRDILLRDKGQWIRKKKQFDHLVERLPEHARFTLTGRDDSGFLSFVCTCLGRDNFCTSYEGRPSLCRNYPSKSLYYQGGWLRADCGFSFKAVTFRDVIMRRRRVKVPAFSTVLEREIEQENTK